MVPLKNDMGLRENTIYIRLLFFQCIQLINSIPEKWKFIITKNNDIGGNLLTHDHHLIKGSRVITLDKLTSTEIYSILILKVQNKPSSNIYFEKLLNHVEPSYA